MIRVDYLHLMRRLRDEVGVHDVIAPFGFELVRGWDFNPVRPQRAYIYVDPRGADRNLLAEAIANWLRANATALEAALESKPLSIVSVDNRRVVTSFRTEPGLACFVYFVDSDEQTLLDCYATYIALLPAAIVEGSLNEIRNFQSTPSCRRFVFQVTRMFAESHQLLLSRPQDLELATAAQSNFSHSPGTLIRQVSEADIADCHALESIVFPTARVLSEDLSRDPTTSVTWVDFHSGERVQRTVNARINEIRARVVDAYSTAGLGGSDRVA